MSCLPRALDMGLIDSLDMIAKGTITAKPEERMPMAEGQPDRVEIPFTLTVTKAWKSTSVGQKLDIVYQVSGGDGFPYHQGESIIYATRDKDGRLVVNGCSGAYNVAPETSADIVLDKLMQEVHNRAEGGM